jgi:predicted PurR-regulated permease PerM
VPGIPETDRLRRVALGIWATIGGILLIAAFWWMSAQIRIIWMPLAFAIGLVVLLDPIVRGLQRIAIPRIFGAVFAFVVFIAAIVAVGFLVVPVVQEQAAEFADRLPVLYDETVDWLREVGDQLGIDLGPVWTSETIQEWVQDPANQETIQQLIGGFGSGAGRVLAGVAEFVVIAVLAPILAFYMLLDAPRSRRMLLGHRGGRIRQGPVARGDHRRSALLDRPVGA